MTTNNIQSKIEWRLHTVMSERGIRTATQLMRELQSIGISISSVQLSRLVNGPPKRISSELLFGLMEVLDCDASEIIRRPESAEKAVGQRPKPAYRPMKKRVNKIKKDISPAHAAGPKVTPIPMPTKPKK